ncbi:MAG: MEDS domain-containing protein [Chloroflexota bacterium]
MASATHPLARLGGDDLRNQRHVCALLDGPEEADARLLPFILDGIAKNERSVHFVDGRRRDDYLETLERGGLDTESALDNRSLQIDTWEDTYLRDGRFDPAAMVEIVRATMTEGRALGFSRTRLIGYMEWALEDAPGVGRIIDFELRLQLALRLLPDLVICAYDIARHPQTVILETITAHPIALIGGILRPTGGQLASPRERILVAASELFTRQGVGGTGVDTLIESAGVAKATFYRHFPSKDDLIVAWLRDPRTRWLDRMQLEAQERADLPIEIIPAFFEAVVDWLGGDGARGCPYLDTAIAMPDLALPARVVIREYLAEVETYLRDRLVDAGVADADALAARLYALLAGGMTLSVAAGETSPAVAARDAAEVLVRDAATA